jgi:hypothetical protein
MVDWKNLGKNMVDSDIILKGIVGKYIVGTLAGWQQLL